MSRAVVRGLVWLLHGYQRYVSAALPPVCRFSPTCSSYAIEALQVHGLPYGCWLTLRRLLRCAPWHPGGIDPVPPRRSGSCRARSTTDRHDLNHHEEPSSC